MAVGPERSQPSEEVRAGSSVGAEYGGHEQQVLPWRGIATAVFVGIVVRVVLAFVADGMAAARGRLCFFDDTGIYWHLAGTILRGEPYVVMQYDQPHFALRTPGYPLFLAGCRALFGDGTLGPRVVQAICAGLSVLVLVALVRRAMPTKASGGREPSLLLWTAWLSALEPWSAGMSVLLLSEALFIPLMLAGLWGLGRLFGVKRVGYWAWGCAGLFAGVLQGIATLVRPSWALFAPMAALVLLLVAPKARRGWACAGVAGMAVGASALMAPWWVRNGLVIGHFVPTAVWFGASLYDGLRPDADGASDMRFLDDPEVRALDEWGQDRELRRRAVRFMSENPLTAARLALIKLGRYFSPWPNDANLRSVWVVLGSALVTIPLFVLISLGCWKQRGNVLALVLLAGPLVYFAAVHAVFVSSVRYRIPAMVPTLGLAASALPWRWIIRKGAGSGGSSA